MRIVRTHFTRRAVIVAALLSPFTSAFANNTYYQQFGQKAGIEAVVNRFVGYVLSDRRISHYFATTDIPSLKSALTDQFCQEEGGPCTYTGPSMSSVHKGLGVNEAAFNALVSDLIKGMNRQHVPLDAQNNLLSKLAPMESQIVTR